MYHATLSTSLLSKSKQLLSILHKNPEQINHFVPDVFLQQPSILKTTPYWQKQDYDFFGLWLDPSLSFHSGLFDQIPEDQLYSAQKKNYENLLQCISNFLATKVLVSQCSWGALLTQCMAKGYDTTSLYTDPMQKDYCEQLLHYQPQHVNYLLTPKPLQEISGSYDAIIDLEGLNNLHVDLWEERLKDYYNKLPKGGIAFLQILIATDPQTSTLFTPKNQTPTLKQLQKWTKRVAMETQITRNISHDYLKTVTIWIKQFLAHYDHLTQTSADTHLWASYLALLHAQLSSHKIQALQLVLQK